MAVSFFGVHKKDILTFTFKKPYFFKNIKKLVLYSLEKYIQYVSCQQNL